MQLGSDWNDMNKNPPRTGKKLLFMRKDGFCAYGIKRGSVIELSLYRGTVWAVSEVVGWKPVVKE